MLGLTKVALVSKGDDTFSGVISGVKMSVPVAVSPVFSSMDKIYWPAIDVTHGTLQTPLLQMRSLDEISIL
jgi:hypothetical protein